MANVSFRNLATAVLFVGISFVNYGLDVTHATAAPPSKPPAPTSTATQNWDQNLPSASRFTVLADFGGAAVRDNNTGLVWEQAPDASTLRTWEAALDYCANKGVGGTVGWRLPSVVELKSLQDPSLLPPYVPNSVFDNVQSIQFPSFWSATTNAVISDLAWVVQFWNNDVASGSKTGSRNVWCVRAGMNENAY